MLSMARALADGIPARIRPSHVSASGLVFERNDASGAPAPLPATAGKLSRLGTSWTRLGSEA